MEEDLDSLTPTPDLLSQNAQDQSHSTFKKVKHGVPCDAAIPLLGKSPKEMKVGTQTDTHPPMFLAVLFTIVKKRE